MGVGAGEEKLHEEQLRRMTRSNGMELSRLSGEGSWLWRLLGLEVGSGRKRRSCLPDSWGLWQHQVWEARVGEAPGLGA